MNININVVPEEDTVIPMEVDMAVTDGSGVESVNGKTGAVVLTAKDVGAMSEGYRAPVSSVNGMKGAVVIGNASTTSAGLMSATDKGRLNALYDDYSSAMMALGV